jgi:hypothetical protein
MVTRRVARGQKKNVKAGASIEGDGDGEKKKGGK